MIRIKEGFRGQQQIVLPPMIVEQQKEDRLTQALYITDIGYYPHAAGHFRERKEPISEYILIYCVEGKGHYHVYESEYTVMTNQYFILPAGEPHSYHSDERDPWSIYWIHFSGSLATFFAEKAQRPQNVRPGLTSRITDRNSIFQEILITLSYGYEIENLRYASTLLSYYLGSMRFLHQFRSSQKEENRINSSDIVTVATHYMEEHLGTELSLAELTTYIGYSVSHFSAIFHKQTGQSPIEYFNRMKITRAQELLRTTDLKVNQICSRLGFSDPFYFSRLFSKYTGISPRQFRESATLEKMADSTGQS